jgi:diphosphomevalonate decarboxylase
LIQALKENQWQEAFEITWAEFWDMHAMFETSSPSFGYFDLGSIEVLQKVREFWKKQGDGPLVTMDAGANVHLLYRADQGAMYEHLRQKLSSIGMVFVSLENRPSVGSN